jgi:hypothetical protein
MIFATGKGNLQLKGSCSLYGLDGAPSDVRVRVIVDDRMREFEVDLRTNTFSGHLDIGKVDEATVRTELTVNGRVVAHGLIVLPPLDPPCVHIIRFSSASLS